VADTHDTLIQPVDHAGELGDGKTGIGFGVVAHGFFRCVEYMAFNRLSIALCLPLGSRVDVALVDRELVARAGVPVLPEVQADLLGADIGALVLVAHEAAGIGWELGTQDLDGQTLAADHRLGEGASGEGLDVAHVGHCRSWGANVKREF